MAAHETARTGGQYSRGTRQTDESSQRIRKHNEADDPDSEDGNQRDQWILTDQWQQWKGVECVSERGRHDNCCCSLIDLQFSFSSKDLNQLRCQEQRITKLADMIKNALNELGCEELPSGCDDLSVEQAFIDANGNVDQTVRNSLPINPLSWFNSCSRVE